MTEKIRFHDPKIGDSQIKSHGKCQCGEDLVCAWEWEFGSQRHAQMLLDRKGAKP